MRKQERGLKIDKYSGVLNTNNWYKYCLYSSRQSVVLVLIRLNSKFIYGVIYLVLRINRAAVRTNNYQISTFFIGGVDMYDITHYKLFNSIIDYGSLQG